MMGFGERLRAELFGTSHGPQVGVRIRGLPLGTPVDLDALQTRLDRRRPAGRRLATRRREADQLVVDWGLTAGRIDGPEFRAHVDNTDVRSADYRAFARTPRPGHADYPARVRFGAEADLAGGGIFSGRMTVGLVVAGGIAAQLLERAGIEVASFTQQIGPVAVQVPEARSLEEIRRGRDANEIGCPDNPSASAMEELVQRARREGDSVGGAIETRIEGVPVGLGEPFFDSIESVLAHLAFAIPAVKAIEFGSGFSSAAMRGSEHNDPFVWAEGRVRTASNHAGGILGGLATGMPIRFRVAVKPTSSIARPQRTVDVQRRTATEIRVPGRHDPCIVPRAVVVVESVAAWGIAELALRGGFLS